MLGYYFSATNFSHSEGIDIGEGVVKYVHTHSHLAGWVIAYLAYLQYGKVGLVVNCTKSGKAYQFGTPIESFVQVGFGIDYGDSLRTKPNPNLTLP